MMLFHPSPSLGNHRRNRDPVVLGITQRIILPKISTESLNKFKKTKEIIV